MLPRKRINRAKPPRVTAVVQRSATRDESSRIEAAFDQLIAALIQQHLAHGAGAMNTGGIEHEQRHYTLDQSRQ
jgi:hypothetical protein